MERWIGHGGGEAVVIGPIDNSIGQHRRRVQPSRSQQRGVEGE